MDSLPSLSNPPQQPVPSSEGWDTQHSKVLQGLEYVLGRRDGREGEVGMGGFEERDRREWEGRGGGGREGKLIETEMNCDDQNGPGREVTMERTCEHCIRTATQTVLTSCAQKQ